MITAIYARKSTEQNVSDDAKSVSRQVEHAQAFAKRHGWIVDPLMIFVDDAISGAEFQRRPGLARLLAAVPSKAFGAIVMAAPDRLGREMVETSYTLKRI